MTQVVFEEENPFALKRRKVVEGSFTERLLVKSGLAKTPKIARLLLLCMAILGLIGSFVIWGTRGINDHVYGNYETFTKNYPELIE